MRYVMKQKMFSFGNDFAIKDGDGREVFYVDGKALSIADFRGRGVVMNFWAIFCLFLCFFCLLKMFSHFCLAIYCFFLLISVSFMYYLDILRSFLDTCHILCLFVTNLVV